MVPKHILLVLLFVATTPLFAYRREYEVTLHDVRKAGSEVCFYRGGPASDAFALFFSYDRVGCLSADDVLDLPSGLFHVFARHGQSYASRHLDFFVITGGEAHDAGYEKLQIPLAEAGTVDFGEIVKTLIPGQTAGIWVGPMDHAGGMFIPLVNGEASVLAPAGTDLLPLVVEKGQPVAVGNVLRVRAGQKLVVPRFSQERGYGDVVGWLKLDSRAAKDASGTLPLPRIELTAGSAVFTPVTPLRNSRNATHTLLIFKRVPIGRATLTVAGRTWVGSETHIEIGNAAVTTERQPVILSPAAALDLVWDSALTHSTETGNCPVKVEGRPRITATLRSCGAELTPDGIAKTTCVGVARESRPLGEGGMLSFDGIVPGDYEIEVDVPFKKEKVNLATKAGAGAIQTVVLPISTFDFFGKVSINARPSKARLIFASGETVSDETGMYTAKLTADPLANIIDVVVCEDGKQYRYVVQSRINENSRYDVDISTRRLSVSVKEPNGGAIADARVTYAPLKSAGTASYSSAPARTDSSGEVTFEVPIDQKLTVCATHESHMSNCARSLSFGSSSEVKADLYLTPINLRGRVVGHLGSGMIIWAGAAGNIIEQAELDADGTFRAEGRPGTAYLVYVSDKRPLAVLPWTPSSAGRTEVVIPLPSVISRSFRVNVPGMNETSGCIGVWVGGRLIPIDALQRNQESRGIDVLIHRGRPITILDIAETAPIEVAYAPFPRDGVEFVDPFTVPPYSAVQRRTVDGSDVVITP